MKNSMSRRFVDDAKFFRSDNEFSAIIARVPRVVPRAKVWWQRSFESQIDIVTLQAIHQHRLVSDESFREFSRECETQFNIDCEP